MHQAPLTSQRKQGNARMPLSPSRLLFSPKNLRLECCLRMRHGKPEANSLCMYLQVLIKGSSLHSVLLDAPGLPQALQLLLLALR